MGIDYDLSAPQFNWRAIPNSAWLGLLAAGVLCATLSVQQPARALYVNTNGSCLNARYGPGTEYGVYTCVTNGSALIPPSGRTAGNWIELETGRWVYGPYTSARPDFNPGGGTGGRSVQVRTPSGACLNARYEPSMDSGVYACVRNGATLLPVTNTAGSWLQLSSGRWVYAPYTTYGTGGQVNPPSPSESSPLRRGMRGESISTLQNKLTSLGYSVGASGADGVFGASTEAAVRRFQADKGLQIDGIVGLATKGAMGLMLPGEGA